jgi:hypothetical protein
MRVYDKNENIRKANLLAEQRHVEYNSLVREYEFDIESPSSPDSNNKKEPFFCGVNTGPSGGRDTMKDALTYKNAYEMKHPEWDVQVMSDGGMTFDTEGVEQLYVTAEEVAEGCGGAAAVKLNWWKDLQSGRYNPTFRQ